MGEEKTRKKNGQVPEVGGRKEVEPSGEGQPGNEGRQRAEDGGHPAPASLIRKEAAVRDNETSEGV